MTARGRKDPSADVGTAPGADPTQIPQREQELLQALSVMHTRLESLVGYVGRIEAELDRVKDALGRSDARVDRLEATVHRMQQV